MLYIWWDIDPVFFEIGSFGLRYYSLLFGVAFLLGLLLMRKMYRKEGLHEGNLNPLLIYIVIGTIIGARLGQTLFYEFDYYRNHPLEIVLPFRRGPNGWEWVGFQGLASHGGALGVLAAVALYARRYRQAMLPLLDKLVIVVALAGCFIRLGNLFNSEILGQPTTVPWAFVFVRVDLLPRHPAQLYEAIAYLVIFLVLWSLYHQQRRWRDGFLFGLFLLLVFSARFVIEFVKEDQAAFERGMALNMGQVLSIPFMLAGLFLIVVKARPKDEAAFLSTPKDEGASQE